MWLVMLAACVLQVVCGLNYTGETALLDAAPEITNRRHATAVTFGELGVFDFRGDGRARVALELGAFSSEKDTEKKKIASSGSSQGKRSEGDVRPVRELDGVELDHVYLIFAKARAVNNFVARLHTAQQQRHRLGVENDELAALMLCSDVGSWLESEFVAPIKDLKRPEKKKQDNKVEPEEPKKDDGDEQRPRISFISAATPTAAKEARPLPTRVTGMHRRDAEALALRASNATTATTSSPGPGATESPALLGSGGAKSNDVFLVEYEWEWLVQHGGEYAVVIANCAATTVQFKYNLIMANRWADGQWTNVPAGWMPVQQVYPAASYALWGAATAAWLAWLGYAHLQKKTPGGLGRGGSSGSSSGRQARPLLGVVVGFVPVLRFLSCLADQSRYGSAWGGNGGRGSGGGGGSGGVAYEATMVVVSTSLVDALADAAQMLVVLALAKGWGVVRGGLAGGEKRLVPGLVVFVGVATLYDGATRGGGLLAVAVLQLTSTWYAWASARHTRRAHTVQVLRLVSRNERALRAWRELCGTWTDAPEALDRLAGAPWPLVDGLPGAGGQRAALALVWSAVQKDRVLRRVTCVALPLQMVDVAVAVCAGLAVPPHRAYVALLVAQAAHWLAFLGVFAVLALGPAGAPDVPLPALPAIATRRSIPLPPHGAGRRARPPLGRLRLLRSNAPFGPSADHAG
ncbi:hypothetical protein LPJ53_003329 [Coemansia erecta]|uniref:Uncharacterized protein n=1 Tax=Coemansia erecta TaxID=147472 RepID=A0A9W8CQA6_9FUNG|nr:hypothetical protein LPJ53_003329 [Coemansia erecta]